MFKLNAIPLALMISTMLLTADVFAQGGRGHQANQQRPGRAAQQNAWQSDRRNASRGNERAQRSNRSNGREVLTANERQGLILMREEEKLARDVYRALHAKWSVNVFANISRAESRHMNAIGNLLTRYNIPDPIKDNSPGVFTNAQFQQLYSQLVATGSESLENALKVGLKIEEMDIADLRVALRSTNNPEIKRVLENLLRGSRNHLRAFASQLKAVDGTYVSEHLNQADFNSIANSQQKSGRGNGKAGHGGKNRPTNQGSQKHRGKQRPQGNGTSN